MEVNGITVPDPSETVEYYPDPIGGWMYIVTTRVGVLQKTLVGVKQELVEAKAQLVIVQAKIDELEPQVADFEEATKK